MFEIVIKKHNSYLQNKEPQRTKFLTMFEVENCQIIVQLMLLLGMKMNQIACNLFLEILTYW